MSPLKPASPHQVHILGCLPEDQRQHLPGPSHCVFDLLSSFVGAYQQLPLSRRACDCRSHPAGPRHVVGLLPSMLAAS